MVAGGEDADVAFDQLLTARSTLRDTLAAVVEAVQYVSLQSSLPESLSPILHNPGFLELLDIATQPLGSAGADLLEDVIVDHWCLREKTFVAVLCWRNVGEITVEEDPEKIFRYEREWRLGAEDVEREQDVDNGVARYDPLLGAREHVGLLGIFVRHELESLDC